MAGTLGVRKKYRLRKFLSGKLTYLLLIVLAIVFSRAAIGMYKKGMEALAKREETYQELERLKTRENELRAEIARLSTPRGVEEEIRDRFMVSRDGESVAVITSDSEDREEGLPSQKQNFWQKILSAVGFSK